MLLAELLAVAQPVAWLFLLPLAERLVAARPPAWPSRRRPVVAPVAVWPFLLRPVEPLVVARPPAWLSRRPLVVAPLAAARRPAWLFRRRLLAVAQPVAWLFLPLVAVGWAAVTQQPQVGLPAPEDEPVAQCLATSLAGAFSLPFRLV